MRIPSAQDEWLDAPENLDVWLSTDNGFTASEKRCKMAEWSAKAYKEFCSYDNAKARGTPVLAQPRPCVPVSVPPLPRRQ